MKLNIIFFIFLCTQFYACANTKSYLQDASITIDQISFDAVEKELILEEINSKYLKTFLQEWFQSKVKINGYEGKLLMKLYNYDENILNIDNGKKIELSLNFDVKLLKQELMQTITLNGTVRSYGSITGDFSLNDFDTLIRIAQDDLINRLIKVLEK